MPDAHTVYPSYVDCKMISLLDSYELKARIAPSMIAIMPVIVVLACYVSSFGLSAIQTIAGGVIFDFALAYTISTMVRDRGKSLEQALWERWEGAPTTRILRWRDSTLAPEVKRRLHAYAMSKFELSLLDSTCEAADPAEADRRIAAAFRCFKELLRQKDSNGLWSKHNAEYGFARNLFAVKSFWLLQSFLAMLVCLIGYWTMNIPEMLGGLIVSSIMLLIAALFSRRLESYVRKTADEYAASSCGSVHLIACSHEAMQPTAAPSIILTTMR